MDVVNMGLGDARALRAAARPLRGETSDYDELIARAGDFRLVLLGAPTQGTHELQRERALISERLIVDKGFAGVAADADGRQARRIDRWVRGSRNGAEAGSPLTALASFAHFPSWQWRHEDAVRFIAWMRGHNEGGPARRAGFWGLDTFGLSPSMELIVSSLERIDAAAAERVRERFGAFDEPHQSMEAYAMAGGMDVETAEDEVVAEVAPRLAGQPVTSDDGDEDAPWYAGQDATRRRSAEAYVRALFRGRVAAWDMRTQQIADALDTLLEHIERRLGRAHLVVWAHNAQVGDARATEMHTLGELSLGQLMRERYPRDCLLVGFTTFAGTVTAARRWGGPPETMRLRPLFAASHEARLHATGEPASWMWLCDDVEAAGVLRESRPSRLVGAVYHPDAERVSHTLEARMADQFDVVVHVDETRALTTW